MTASRRVADYIAGRIAVRFITSQALQSILEEAADFTGLAVGTEGTRKENY